MTRARLIATALTIIIATQACANGAPEESSRHAPRASVPGEYLVQIASDADEKSIVDVYGRFGLRTVRALGNGLFLIALTQDPGLAVLDQLREQGEHIKSVQPNFRYRAQ